MAGSEKSGPEHADAALYENSVCLVEDCPDVDREARDRVLALWARVGARTVPIDPFQHDTLLAHTSHVPHIVAAAIASTAAREGATLDVIGNGFRDVTRIAAGSPEMWCDISLTNAAAIRAGLAAVKSELDRYLAAIDAKDATMLLELFAAGRDARARVIGE